MTWFRMKEGRVREIVEPISQPPGLRARRQFARKVCGVVVFGSMCSITSKRVTMSYWGGWGVVDGESGCDEEGEGEDVAGEGDGEMRSSSVVFRYLNFPLRRCASTVGSMRACLRAIWMSVVVGSMAVIDAARVGVGAGEEGSSGIVRASDSAKMPPPQPMSR